VLADLSRADAFGQPAPCPEQDLVALALPRGRDLARDAADRFVSVIRADGAVGWFDLRWLPEQPVTQPVGPWGGGCVIQAFEASGVPEDDISAIASGIDPMSQL
jgi:hypothetical protein